MDTKKQMSEAEQGKTAGKITDSAGKEYQKLDDWFIETYLLRKGETIEEAKKRLSKNLSL